MHKKGTKNQLLLCRNINTRTIYPVIAYVYIDALCISDIYLLDSTATKFGKYKVDTVLWILHKDTQTSLDYSITFGYH